MARKKNDTNANRIPACGWTGWKIVVRYDGWGGAFYFDKNGDVIPLGSRKKPHVYDDVDTAKDAAHRLGLKGPGYTTEAVCEWRYFNTPGEAAEFERAFPPPADDVFSHAL